MGRRRDDFLQSYVYCAVTRNLQILGAFAFLSQVKGKPHFERYIPRAVRTLKERLADPRLGALSALNATVASAAGHLHPGAS